jgi:excinuclease ABC subunit C
MGGKDVVASQVVFKNGVSSKTDYRNYKITKQQNNDFESMADVISRRFKMKNIESWGIPDLLLIDGGKGQLSSAINSLENKAIPMFGLAKQFEQIIIQRHDPNFNLDFRFATKTNRIISEEAEHYVISLSPKDPIRLLIERIRNEAHRFAVRYHTKLKRGHVKTTELTKIPGIGAETARKLLITFGSVTGVKSATHNQLTSVVGNIKAKNIERYFNRTS